MKLIKTTKIDKLQVSVYQPETSGIFRQWFSDALKVSENELENKLKNHAFTEKQIDTILDRQDKKDIGLRTDGWANFFPVVDADGSVSVVYAYRLDGRWRRRVDWLGSDFVWGAGRRFVLSNSDPSNLVDSLPLELEINGFTYKRV